MAAASLLFDAQPSAAGVFPEVATRPIAPLVWRHGRAGTPWDRDPARPMRAPPGATLVWTPGRAHPFPQASCGMKYRAGGNGVNKAS